MRLSLTISAPMREKADQDLNLIFMGVQLYTVQRSPSKNPDPAPDFFLQKPDPNKIQGSGSATLRSEHAKKL